VIFVDTADAAGSGPRQSPLPGFVVMRQPGELVEFLRVHRHGDFRVCYKPGLNAEAHFWHIARLVWALRDVVFAVDEIWTYLPAAAPPSDLPEPLRSMALRGRVRGICLLWIAQRPQLVASTLRSVTTEYKVFRLGEQLDLKALRGRVPQAALDQVPALPDRVHIARDEGNNWQVVG
jgi:hypothetical protein